MIIESTEVTIYFTISIRICYIGHHRGGLVNPLGGPLLDASSSSQLPLLLFHYSCSHWQVSILSSGKGAWEWICRPKKTVQLGRLSQLRWYYDLLHLRDYWMGISPAGGEEVKGSVFNFILLPLWKWFQISFQYFIPFLSLCDFVGKYCRMLHFYSSAKWYTIYHSCTKTI